MLLTPLKHNNSHILPDPFDAKFYCRAFKTIFKSLTPYLQHCRETYRMTLDPIVKTFVDDDAVIGIDSADFYCTKCEKQLSSRKTYVTHLRRVHLLEPIKSRISNATINVFNPNFYCAVCNKHICRRNSFKYHLKAIHNLKCPS